MDAVHLNGKQNLVIFVEKVGGNYCSTLVTPGCDIQTQKLKQNIDMLFIT